MKVSSVWRNYSMWGHWTSRRSLRLPLELLLYEEVESPHIVFIHLKVVILKLVFPNPSLSQGLENDSKIKKLKMSRNLSLYLSCGKTRGFILVVDEMYKVVFSFPLTWRENGVATDKKCIANRRFVKWWKVSLNIQFQLSNCWWFLINYS